jgi:hypothetical protein
MEYTMIIHVRSGSDSDFGEWRAGVRFHLESGPDLAQQHVSQVPIPVA